MKSTYINDNFDTVYPFYNLTEPLPFPTCCIVGLHVAVVEPAAAVNYIYIGSVTITDNAIAAVVFAHTTEDIRLGTVVTTVNGTCVFNAASGYQTARCHMYIGSIPASAVGAYAGRFYVDPACVYVMPQGVYGNISSIHSNRCSTECGQALGLRFTGLLEVSVSGSTATLAGNSSCAERDMTNRYSMAQEAAITNINGYSVARTGSTGYTMKVSVAADSDIRAKIVATGGTASGDVAVIELVGGTTFPKCGTDPVDDAASDYTV